MPCVIYNRVSSMRQNSYISSVSLQAQESMCSKFAYENKLNISSVYKEVHSAFNKVPGVLKTVINLKKSTIIISDISRFSRSISIGIEMATTSIKNKNKIVFIQEKFVCSEYADLTLLEKQLKKTEGESLTIGIRVKRSRDYLIEKGLFVGAFAPYGHNIINRKAIENVYEQNVLKFIDACKTFNITSVILNKNMNIISKLPIYEPIICYSKDGSISDRITTRLANTEIANLLNSYNVDKRGKKWSSSMIKTAYESNERQKTNELARKPTSNLLSKWGSIETEIEKISGSNKKSKVSLLDTPTNTRRSTPTTNIHTWYHTRITDPTPEVKEQSRLIPTNVKKTRRSVRLNPDLSHNIQQSNQTFMSDDINNIRACTDMTDDINHDSTTDMTDDIKNIQLFNQFRQFIKIMKK